MIPSYKISTAAVSVPQLSFKKIKNGLTTTTQHFLKWQPFSSIAGRQTLISQSNCRSLVCSLKAEVHPTTSWREITRDKWLADSSLRWVVLSCSLPDAIKGPGAEDIDVEGLWELWYERVLERTVRRAWATIEWHRQLSDCQAVIL